MRLHCKLSASVAVLLVVALASAQEAKDAAKIRAAAEEYDAGRRAYLDKDYETAALHFENADRDAPSAGALRLAIRARMEAHHSARAATLSELAMRRYPADDVTTQLAKETLKKLTPSLLKVDVRCEPACALVVDDRAPFNEAAVEQVLYLDPGQHSIFASWPGRQGRSAQAEGPKGASRQVLLHPGPPLPQASPTVAQPHASGSPPPPVHESGISPGFFYAGAGLTLALAGVTVWSGLDTRAHPGPDRVEKECVNLGESCPAYQEGLSSQRRTNILIGSTAGMAAITGVLALVTRWGGSESTASPSGSSTQLRVVPSVSWTQGPQLGATGRF
jgi:hypothetical protein